MRSAAEPAHLDNLLVKGRRPVNLRPPKPLIEVLADDFADPPRQVWRECRVCQGQGGEMVHEDAA